MARIDFVDQSLRDGQQSLWGFRMRAGHVLPIADAIDTVRHALQHLRVEGVQTTAGFARDLLAHPDVVAAQTHTRWIEEEFMPTWNGR